MIVVQKLKNSEHGIDVHFQDNSGSYVIRDVHPGAVKLAIGENEMESLLEAQGTKPLNVSKDKITSFIQHQVC